MVNKEDLEKKLNVKFYTPKEATKIVNELDHLYDFANENVKENPEFAWAVYQKIVDDGHDLMKYYYSRSSLNKASNLVASSKYQQVLTEPYIKFHFSEKKGKSGKNV